MKRSNASKIKKKMAELAAAAMKILQEGKDPYIVRDENGVYCVTPKEISSSDKVIIGPDKLREWVTYYNMGKVIDKVQYILNK